MEDSELECITHVPVIDRDCLEGCQGLYVTSYFKSKLEENDFATFWSKVDKDYDKYKEKATVNFPEKMKGK